MRTPLAGSRTRTSIVLLLLTCASAASTGCQSVPQLSGNPLSLNGGAAAQEQSKAQNGPTYRVEVAPADGRPRSVVRPLTEGLTLQEAVDRTGARKKLGKINVEVVRIDPATKQQIKMGVKFNKKRKQILPNYNYTLHPGDRIVIREDTTNMLDSALGSLTGVFGR